MVELVYTAWKSNKKLEKDGLHFATLTFPCIILIKSNYILELASVLSKLNIERRCIQKKDTDRNRDDIRTVKLIALLSEQKLIFSTQMRLLQAVVLLHSLSYKMLQHS